MLDFFVFRVAICNTIDRTKDVDAVELPGMKLQIGLCWTALLNAMWEMELWQRTSYRLELQLS